MVSTLCACYFGDRIVHSVSNWDRNKFSVSNFVGNSASFCYFNLLILANWHSHICSTCLTEYSNWTKFDLQHYPFIHYKSSSPINISNIPYTYNLLCISSSNKVPIYNSSTKKVPKNEINIPPDSGSIYNYLLQGSKKTLVSNNGFNLRPFLLVSKFGL